MEENSGDAAFREVIQSHENFSTFSFLPSPQNRQAATQKLMYKSVLLNT